MSQTPIIWKQSTHNGKPVLSLDVTALGEGRRAALLDAVTSAEEFNFIRGNAAVLRNGDGYHLILPRPKGNNRKLAEKLATLNERTSELVEQIPHSFPLPINNPMEERLASIKPAQLGQPLPEQLGASPRAGWVKPPSTYDPNVIADGARKIEEAKRAAANAANPNGDFFHPDTRGGISLEAKTPSSKRIPLPMVDQTEKEMRDILDVGFDEIDRRFEEKEAARKAAAGAIVEDLPVTKPPVEIGENLSAESQEMYAAMMGGVKPTARDKQLKDIRPNEPGNPLPETLNEVSGAGTAETPPVYDPRNGGAMITETERMHALVNNTVNEMMDNIPRGKNVISDNLKAVEIKKRLCAAVSESMEHSVPADYITHEKLNLVARKMLD